MKDPRLYLLHIVESADKIERYIVAGREAFQADPKTQDAVVRNFEIIGEAAKRVPEDIRSKAADVPWRQIAGLRDVLIHQGPPAGRSEVFKLFYLGNRNP